MKKFFLFVITLTLLTNTCFAGVIINNVSTNKVTNNIINFKTTLSNPDNVEHHDVIAIVTFFDGNGNALSQTQTRIDYIRPNDRVTVSFNCHLPQSATNYKIDYVSSNVVIPNYVYYQKTYPPLFPDNGNITRNTISNTITRIILNTMRR